MVLLHLTDISVAVYGTSTPYWHFCCSVWHFYTLLTFLLQCMTLLHLTDISVAVHGTSTPYWHFCFSVWYFYTLLTFLLRCMALLHLTDISVAVYGTSTPYWHFTVFSHISAKQQCLVAVWRIVCSVGLRSSSGSEFRAYGCLHIRPWNVRTAAMCGLFTLAISRSTYGTSFCLACSDTLGSRTRHAVVSSSAYTSVFISHITGYSAVRVQAMVQLMCL